MGSVLLDQNWTKNRLVAIEPQNASLLYHGLRFGCGFRFYKLLPGVMKIQILEPLRFSGCYIVTEVRDDHVKSAQ